MNQLETLLNTLIQMGWKPWGKLEANECTVEYQKQVCIWNKHYRMLRKGSLREFVSLESGLWQFVCENKLQNKKHSEGFNGLGIKVYNEGCDARVGVYSQCYEYRLLESSLVPEEDLAKFLLDNIKIEGK